MTVRQWMKSFVRAKHTTGMLGSEYAERVVSSAVVSGISSVGGPRYSVRYIQRIGQKLRQRAPRGEPMGDFVWWSYDRGAFYFWQSDETK